MHREAREWVEQCIERFPDAEVVVEIGSRNINGGIRDLFLDSTFVGVDLVDGPGVDIVGDATLIVLPACDLVVSTEALEHYPEPWKVIDAAHKALNAGGVFVATMAGPGRQSHSGLIEGPVQPGEHYRNIEPGELRSWLEGWASMELDQFGADLRCWAIK